MVSGAAQTMAWVPSAACRLRFGEHRQIRAATIADRQTCQQGRQDCCHRSARCRRPIASPAACRSSYPLVHSHTHTLSLLDRVAGHPAPRCSVATRWVLLVLPAGKEELGTRRVLQGLLDACASWTDPPRPETRYMDRHRPAHAMTGHFVAAETSKPAREGSSRSMVARRVAVVADMMTTIPWFTLIQLLIP